jgi:hypothetical protein
MENEIVRYKSAPHAGLNPAGDCGPACLAGITGYSVREIYDRYFRGRIDGTSYDDMYAACWKLFWEEKFQWVTNELPKNCKRAEPKYQIFGNPSWENFREWAAHADQKINHAGCVGIAQVNMRGNAFGDRKHQLSTDHWVLIVGVDYDKDAPAVDLKVHVSCSTLGEYSKDVFEFLMNYGGYNAIWVKPKKI